MKRDEAQRLPSGPLAWIPHGADLAVLACLVVGLALLYLPTYWDLSHTVWANDEQGHGPIILAVSLWLMSQRRHQLAELKSQGAPWLGWPLCVFGLLMYVFGRTQTIILLEVSSQIVMFAALILVFKGIPGLRLMAFPLFFLLFMVPLPSGLVAAVTTPLKSAVSSVATSVLAALQYPIGRTGVVLTVGPYQLLVADACAGLNSMFTLEALGLLYMNLMNYQSLARNITLAVLIIPISFIANVVRVVILVLVTYHFGDEAGQGFVHGFAGMVLFLVALILMLMVDKVLGSWIRWPERRST